MSGFVGLLNGWEKLADDGDEQIERSKSSNRLNGFKEGMLYKDELLQLGLLRDEDKGASHFLFGEGRYILAFDGEIYNARNLRASLINKGYLFETDTEAEVLANLFVECGAEAFKVIRGKFAIVIWDTETKVVYAARDGFGIKPLYFVETEEEFIVSTGKNAILALISNFTIDEQALQHYFSFQYVPTSLTLTKGVLNLEPGHYLKKSPDSPLEKHRYFHATFQPTDGDENQMINRVQEVMVDSIQTHVQDLESIGAFLSGGVDSSLVVGIAKQFVPSLKTFTVGFEEEGYSEISVAQKTAMELGVENISKTINSNQFIELLPAILPHLDDPLADPSCIPLYVVAELASNHSKVVLSGEGADELFGGYNIYSEFNSLKFFQHLPRTWNSWLQKLARLLPEGMVGKGFIERGTTPLRERYIGNAKIFTEDEKQAFLTAYNPTQTFQDVTSKFFSEVEGEHSTHQMQYIDIQTWLPGDILYKANRMSNAHLLEIRMPFLDRMVYEVARDVPIQYKINGKQTKVILRKAAKEFIPEHVLDRKKLGFPVPLRIWLRGELYDWVSDVIKESETDYLIDKRYCQKLLQDHASGYRDYSRKIWTFIMFMLWHRIFIEEGERGHSFVFQTKND